MSVEFAGARARFRPIGAGDGGETWDRDCQPLVNGQITTTVTGDTIRQFELVFCRVGLSLRWFWSTWSTQAWHVLCLGEQQQ